MSHFGINPEEAKGFWNDEPVQITQEMLEFKSDYFKTLEHIHKTMLLHDAYYYGLFPNEHAATSEEYLNAFAEIQDITRRHSVSILGPRKMTDVGTIGCPLPPSLNELTRLIRDSLGNSEVNIVMGKPVVNSVIRPEVIEVYKSRRKNPILHVALEDTRNFIVDRYVEIMKGSKPND